MATQGAKNVTYYDVVTPLMVEYVDIVSTKTWIIHVCAKVMSVVNGVLVLNYADILLNRVIN